MFPYGGAAFTSGSQGGAELAAELTEGPIGPTTESTSTAADATVVVSPIAHRFPRTSKCPLLGSNARWLTVSALLPPVPKLGKCLLGVYSEFAPGTLVDLMVLHGPRCRNSLARNAGVGILEVAGETAQNVISAPLPWLRPSPQAPGELKPS